MYSVLLYNFIYYSSNKHKLNYKHTVIVERIPTLTTIFKKWMKSRPACKHHLHLTMFWHFQCNLKLMQFESKIFWFYRCKIYFWNGNISRFFSQLLKLFVKFGTSELSCIHLSLVIVIARLGQKRTATENVIIFAEKF